MKRSSVVRRRLGDVVVVVVVVAADKGETCCGGEEEEEDEAVVVVELVVDWGECEDESGDELQVVIAEVLVVAVWLTLELCGTLMVTCFLYDVADGGTGGGGGGDFKVR